MSGRFSGVQARLKEGFPDSLFVHCANPSLDLVLQEVGREVSLVAETLNFVQGIATVIRIYGPNEGWSSAYPECRERNQSPINIVDQDTIISTEYQELTLEGFDAESSNKTSMKNTGKTVEVPWQVSVPVGFSAGLGSLASRGPSS
ncbi:hypothetical protein JOQ06_027407, partial [Pogonophryne albipinna]